MMKTVEDIFNECQHKDGFNREVVLLLKVFNKTNFKQFNESFFKCFKLCLATQENSPQVVNQTLNFIAKFTIAVNQESESGSENKFEILNNENKATNLMNKIWEFILLNYNATNSYVRLHLCKFVAKLLDVMSDDADLNVELYNLIQKATLRLLRDKNSLVRTQAVWALSRLQDASDSSCPAIKSLMFHLAKDPCSDVRLAIVEVIGLSNKTLPALISRIFDVKDAVREATYKALSKKIHMKLLTIAQRLDILRQGLHDRSAKVRSACVDSLLVAWFEQCSNSLLTCLKCLDVVDATEITKEVFEILISKITVEVAFDKFDLLDDNLIIKPEFLNPEGVFYWKSMCEYLSKPQDENVNQYFEKLLPSFPQYYDFIMKIFEENAQDDDALKQIEKNFICQQLIGIGFLYDFVDENERRRGIVLVKLLLLSPMVNESVTSGIVMILEKVMPNESDRIKFILEVITEIREKVELTEIAINAEERRKLTLRVAQLKVEININRDELETYVNNQEFEKAQQKKERIEQLRNELTEATNALQPQIKETYEEKDDPVTLQKCLLIYCCVLERKILQDPTMLGLVDSLILPSFGKTDVCVRQLAVRALGLSSIANVELASRHLFLFTEICHLDTTEVRMIAIKALFDILLWHGLDMFNSDEQNDAENSKANDSTSSDSVHADKIMTQLLNIFLLMLDSDSSDDHTVACEGICKLLMARRLVSSKTVSRLIVMWYNPITEENHNLRNMLGVFFEALSANSENQKLFEEAFLPTLNIIFDAPSSSPVYQINPLDVAKFMVELTRPSQADEENDKIIHDRLAIKICDEIISDPYSVKVEVLVKTLKHLTISNDFDNISHLDNQCDEMIDAFDDKKLTSLVGRFQNQIKDLKSSTTESPEYVSESPLENNDDEEEIEDDSNL